MANEFHNAKIVNRLFSLELIKPMYQLIGSRFKGKYLLVKKWVNPFSRAVALVLLALLPVLTTQTHAAQEAKGSLQVTVNAIGPDTVPFRVAGVGLTLRGTPLASPLTGFANNEGEYKFLDLPLGQYTLEAKIDGFKSLVKTVEIRSGEIVSQDLTLELAALRESVNVKADADGIKADQSAPPSELKQTTLQTVPLANERFQNALPLVPGVVRGPDGLLNVKGSRASQSGLTVNSANVTDPVTGEFAINLPIEAIESVQVITNPYAPEFGKFIGAVTSIETRQGTDKWKVQFQDFFPRLRRRGGKTVGIESVTPRLAFSGPLVKDKVKFMQSFEYNFIRTKVEGLPPFESDTKLESFDSFTQLDWDINATNHLAISFSLFPQKLGYVGLNTFNPQEVTPNFKQRGFFWAVNEQKVYGNGALLQSFFSIKKFDANVFPSTGNEVMNLSPDINTGSFFNHQDRQTTRIETFEIYNFAPQQLSGTHIVKVSAGYSYNTFDGRNESDRVRILRADGTVSQQIDFIGNGKLNRNKSEYSAYFQDKWSLNDRLTIDYGARFDRDTIADESNFAPRIGFAYLPIADGRTVIRGGVGLFYDKINLNVASFEQSQERLVTRFDVDGNQIIGVPIHQHLALANGEFTTPRSVNWNIELDREWFKDFFLRFGYQQREGRREYILTPVEGPELGNVLQLGNGGNSRYKEFQITARYKFRKSDQFTMSYVRSKATGDLNDFNSFYGNFETPIIRQNERSRLPWDAPNRFLFWGDFSLFYGITLAPVLDIRNGFPVSFIDEERNFVGARNRAGRFPIFSSLDLQVLKTIPLPGLSKKYKARVGLKIFNLTNHFNPRDFQGNLASSSFGGFFNPVRRSFRGKFVIDF